MRGFIKTLIGGKRNFATATICVALAVLLLHTALAPLTGLILPIALLAGAAYLAKH